MDLYTGKKLMLINTNAVKGLWRKNCLLSSIIKWILLITLKSQNITLKSRKYYNAEHLCLLSFISFSHQLRGFSKIRGGWGGGGGEGAYFGGFTVHLPGTLYFVFSFTSNNIFFSKMKSLGRNSAGTRRAEMYYWILKINSSSPFRRIIFIYSLILQEKGKEKVPKI